MLPCHSVLSRAGTPWRCARCVFHAARQAAAALPAAAGAVAAWGARLGMQWLLPLCTTGLPRGRLC